MALNYTQTEDSDGRTHEAPIVRGSRWPAGSGKVTVRLTNSGGWTPGQEDGWTWKLRLDRAEGGGTPDLEITADGATISGSSNEYLDLTFSATPTETGNLPGDGKTRFQVDLVSEDGGGTLSTWPQAHGTAVVRDGVGVNP